MAIPRGLEAEVLLGVFEKFGTVSNPLAKYFPMRANPGQGKIIGYEVAEMQKRLIPPTARGARARVASGPARAMVTLEGITIKEQIPLSAEELADIRDVGSEDPNSQATIARAVRQLRRDFESTWCFLMAQWITGGALVSSANAVPGTPAGNVYLWHEGQAINKPMGPLSLGISATHMDHVAVSWATASTNILGDLDAARALIAADCGVDATRVILSNTTFAHILGNDGATDSEWMKEQIARGTRGKLFELWGYEFDVIADAFPITTDIFNDTAGQQALIPDHEVILTTADNEAAGRAYLECTPVDTRAPRTAKGLFAWTDEDTEHPHDIKPGMEHTGAPMMQNTDAMYIFTDVTATS